jgi:hypothetical protein
MGFDFDYLPIIYDGSCVHALIPREAHMGDFLTYTKDHGTRLLDPYCADFHDIPYLHMMFNAF